MRRDQTRLGRIFPEDIPAIVAAMQDEAIWRWLTAVPQPYGPAEAAQFIAEVGPNEFAIRVGDELAGMLRVENSLGIWVLPRFQRQGIALRAAVLGLSRYFAQPGHDAIEAVYLDGNARSARMLGRLGFAAVAPVTAWSCSANAELPAQSTRLTRSDFVARHGISLTTARLVIDGVKPQDMPALHRICTRPEVSRMLMRFSSDMSLAEVSAIFECDALIPPLRLNVRHQGRVIGSVGLLAGDPPALAYFFDPSMHGQGIGQEAVTAFLHEIIARFDPPELEAGVFADNPASSLILRNLGFQMVDEMRETSLGREAAAAGYVYRLRLRR